MSDQNVAPPPAPGVQQGVPTPPMQGPPMQGGPQPAAPAPKKGLRGRVILRIALAVVAVAVVGIGWLLSRDEPQNAKVGDCISGQTAEDMTIVACTDATASNKVVGRVEGRTAAEFEADLAGICQAYPTAESGFWRGEEGKQGLVLCLEPVNQ